MRQVSIEDAPRTSRPVTVRTEENRQLVSRTFHSNPRTSQRRASHDLNISRTSLQRLMKDLNLKSYKPRLLQALNKDDPDRRLEFCEWIFDSTQGDQILWTDEDTFQTNDRINKHNCVYWSDTNPHFGIQCITSYSMKRNMIKRGRWIVLFLKVMVRRKSTFRC